jgi:hypothetical protein
MVAQALPFAGSINCSKAPKHNVKLKAIRSLSVAIACAALLEPALRAAVSDTAPSPAISPPAETEQSALRSVFVAVADPRYASLSTLTAPPGGLGRTHWKLTEDVLQTLPPLPRAATSTSLSASDNGFDLWDAARLLNAPAGSDFLISFTINAPEQREIIIGVGCFDEVVVSADRRIVFASLGNRDFTRAHDLIPTRLHPGDNVITMLCRKREPWTAIPKDPSQGQWLFSVDLFGSPAVAWKMFRSRNFHLIDTPIVDTISDIRIESVLPGLDIVRLPAVSEFVTSW